MNIKDLIELEEWEELWDRESLSRLRNKQLLLKEIYWSDTDHRKIMLFQLGNDLIKVAPEIEDDGFPLPRLAISVLKEGLNRLKEHL